MVCPDGRGRRSPSPSRITFAVPALGILFLALSLLGIVVVLLPRTWKSNLKMALRNLGRQRARTVTTMVALFIGVFAIGLMLVLGQNIRDKINNALATNLTLQLDHHRQRGQ